MTGIHDWAGGVGDTWAAEWRRTDRSFSDLAPHLDAAILGKAPEQGRAIDIGCGAGATSIALAKARPALQIEGIDMSAALVATARERAAGFANLHFTRVDAASMAGRGMPADLLFSRHGVMFFDDPVAGLGSMRRAARAGAALVFSCFRDVQLNPWAIEGITAITGAPPIRPAGYVPGPFAFADPGFVTATLEAAGWRDIVPQPVDFTYVAGAGPDPVDDAVAFFQRIGPAAPLLRDVPPEARETMIAQLRAVAQRHLKNDVVEFPAAAWIWSARAA